MLISKKYTVQCSVHYREKLHYFWRDRILLSDTGEMPRYDAM
jgi:hypothetical protein